MYHLAGMEMLQELCDNLALWRVVLLPHRPIYQLQHVLVKVVDKLLMTVGVSIFSLTTFR